MKEAKKQRSRVQLYEGGKKKKDNFLLQGTEREKDGLEKVRQLAIFLILP